MKVVIIEDEKPAREHLKRLLLEMDTETVVQAELDTVQHSVQWLQQNETDLIFLDINLADDLCFKIFDQVKLLTPVIFITAYHDYVLRAFEVNSIDYLLKPLNATKLHQALKKYQDLNKKTPVIDYHLLDGLVQQEKKYQTRFLVTRGTILASVKMKDVAGAILNRAEKKG